MASGKYFKWAAYDDIILPTFLEKCVAILESDPTVVLCHTKTSVINERDKVIGNYDHRTLLHANSSKIQERFADLISSRNSCWSIFGVFRADTLRRTALIGNYIGADRNLLAEVGLMGRVYEVPEHLFFRRDHSDSYTRRFCENRFAISGKNYANQASWWTNDKYSYFPNWNNCTNFIQSVRRVPLSPADKVRCYGQIWGWFLKEGWRFMGGDVEDLLMRRSRFARQFLPLFKSRLNRTVLPIIRRR